MSASLAYLADREDQLRFFVVAISLPIAYRDVYRSVKIMIHDNPVIYKLNFLQTFLLLANICANLPSYFGQSIDCMVMTIASYVLYYFAMLTINIILYLEAYYSCKRAKFMAGICLLMLSAQTIFLILSLQGGEFTPSPNGGCKVFLIKGWSIGMLGSTSILMLFLIGVFIMNLYQLPDAEHNQAYRIMIRDSVLFGLAIYLFDILFIILDAIELLDPVITLSLNWVIKSRLMTIMMTTAYRRRKYHLRISLGAAESSTELETKTTYGYCQSSNANLA